MVNIENINTLIPPSLQIIRYYTIKSNLDQSAHISTRPTVADINLAQIGYMQTWPKIGTYQLGPQCAHIYLTFSATISIWPTVLTYQLGPQCLHISLAHSAHISIGPQCTNINFVNSAYISTWLTVHKIKIAHSATAHISTWPTVRTYQLGPKCAHINLAHSAHIYTWPTVRAYQLDTDEWSSNLTIFEKWPQTINFVDLVILTGRIGWVTAALLDAQWEILDLADYFFCAQ